MIRKLPFLIITLWITLLSVSCTPMPERKRVEMRCHSELLSNERIACYKTMIQEKITKRISVGTRHLTPSDWPYDYIIRINVDLDYNGNITSVNMLRETNSRQLNSTIMQTIQKIQQFVVPKDSLFNEGNFSVLKLLIKPARSPILGAEKKVDSDIMIIFLPGACATRSLHC